MTSSTVPYALVVDYDPMILMHPCDILEEAGFRFYEASTGDEAIGVLNNHAESVVLLFSDVEMPGEINRFALARHVDALWPHIVHQRSALRVEVAGRCRRVQRY